MMTARAKTYWQRWQSARKQTSGRYCGQVSDQFLQPAFGRDWDRHNNVFKQWWLDGGTPTLAVVGDKELSAGGEVKLGMEGPGGGGGEGRGGSFNFYARF